MTPNLALTSMQFRRAAKIQAEIEKLQAKLKKVLGDSAGANEKVTEPAKPARRRLSARGLANIRQGVKKREAQRREKLATTSLAPGKSPKAS